MNDPATNGGTMTTEHSDVLIGQAHESVDRITDLIQTALSSDARRVARIAWLDGYKAGMAAVQALADESFRELQDATVSKQARTNERA
jgi:post-segregation antitoxin (ccd killing protein)